MLLLVSGIPASGKSYFCQWLKRKYSFIHFDVDKDDFDLGRSGGFEKTSLLELWRRCYLYNEVIPFVQALQQLKRPVDVDWGFPISLFSIVEALKRNGFSIWWFDANRHQAREEFIKRGHIRLPAYDQQINNITGNWSKIEVLFAPNIIRTLNAQGKRTKPEDIYRKVISVGV